MKNRQVIFSNISWLKFSFSDSGIEDENGVVAEVVTNGQAEQIKAVISRLPTTKTEVKSNSDSKI